MLRERDKQYSFYSDLYTKIPENHLLKRVEEAIDFSFINPLLADSYCKNNGRPAKEPELMMKLHFLSYLYNLSDEKVIEEATFNLAYLWFLGLNPEEPLPHPSLLAKFRKLRLREFTLDDIITELVRQCLENGLVKGSSVSIDTTHIEANTVKKIPERIMKHLAKRIFKGLEEDNGKVPAEINTNIPEYKKIADHKIAKETMKQYLESVIETALPFAGKNTNAAITEAKDILSDERFLIQKGMRSLVDKDARVGSKSKTSQFYGYKDEFMMLTEERIITAVAAHSGEYVDGKEFDSLLDRTKMAGVTPDEISGDKAYFRKDILDRINEEQAEAIIPVSASAYKIDEEQFHYNKDSDEWLCRMGNHTVSKAKKTTSRHGKTYEVYRYIFDRAQCKDCPHRTECTGSKTSTRKVMQVSTNTAEFYEISQRQKDPVFLEKYKKRAAQEWKNGEMKRFHGMARAKGYGLTSVSLQVKFTAIAVNLKRIAALLKGNTPAFSFYFKEIRRIFFDSIFLQREYS